MCNGQQHADYDKEKWASALHDYWQATLLKGILQGMYSRTG